MSFTIIDFLGNILSKITEKDVIIIQDKYYCLENTLNIENQKINVKGHTKSYIVCDTNKVQNFIEFINENDFNRNNIILIVRNERNCIISIRDNCQKLVLDRIRITPRHIFSTYYQSSKKNVFDFSYWDDEIFVLNKFIPDNCLYIIDNEDFYDVIRDDKNKLYKFIVSCLFKEINKILFTDKFFIYIFEKFILFDSIIYDIFNSEDLNKLKTIIIEVLKKELISEAILKFFLLIIKNQNLKIFYHLLISLLILAETANSQILKADLKNFQEKTKPFLSKINIDIFSNEDIKILVEFATEFFKYEIESNNIYKIKEFITPFCNSSLIQEIEYKFDFFISYFQSLPSDISSYKHISFERFLYSSIVGFGMVIYNKLFQISLSYGTTDDFKNLDEIQIAQIRYNLQNLKNNIYFKIKLTEFQLHFEFLEDILIFYQKYQDLINTLNQNSSNSYTFNDWKNIYQYTIVPLDLIHLKISESKRLFWQTKEYQEMVIVLKNKLKQIMNRLSIDFKDFLYNNYPNWISNPSTGPITVINVFQKFFKPGLTSRSSGDYHLFLIIDCCPLNIWKIIKAKILEDFSMFGVKSILGTSILPTSTRWARRALASGKYPFEHRGTWYEADDFFSNISNFPIQNLSSQPSYDSFYTSHCELIDQNDKAILQINNGINYQYCVFNISDESGHLFDLNTVTKIIELTYLTKIKPLLLELISKKPNAIIYFATDHGITRILRTLDWSGTNFHNYRNSSFIKSQNTHPRFFITEQKLNPTKNEILKIENNQVNYGLNERDTRNANQYYYFATGYENFKVEKSAKNIYFAHGGASLFEFLIPFAILSKKLKVIKPSEQPKLIKIINESECEIKINNPFQKSIKSIVIHLIFNNYYFNYYINELDASDTFIIKRNSLVNESKSYEYKIEYYEGICIYCM